MALALLGMSACSRPAGAPSESGATQAGRAPFQDHAATSGGPSVSSPPRQNSSNAEPNLPFLETHELAAGTLLAVRLAEPVLVADGPGSNRFEAVVDEPVVIAGDTLIPQGAAVEGRVQSALTSKVKPNRGYVRLALESVRVGDQDFAVQTASLFARQAQLKDVSTTRIGLEKGRRLVFRLTAPVSLNSQRAHSAHEPSF